MIQPTLISGRTVMIQDRGEVIFINHLSEKTDEAIQQLVEAFFPETEFDLEEIQDSIRGDVSVHELVSFCCRFAAKVRGVQFYPMAFKRNAGFEHFLEGFAKITLHGELLERHL